MKKLSLIFLFVAFVTVSQAQDAPVNVIKINPLGALFGSAQLSYEKALNEKSSFLISPSFGFFKSGEFKYTTLGLGAEYRFYFSKTQAAPEGFYAGPGIGYTFGQAKFDNSMDSHESDKTNVSGLSAKGVLGYQWIFDSGFSLDLNGGLQYYGLKFKEKGGDFANFNAFNGILPALGFGIGYAF